QRVDDRFGELGHLVADARARGTLAAVDRQKRLGHRDRDLRRLEPYDGTVASDDLVLRKARIARRHGAMRFSCQEITWLRRRGGGGSAREMHGLFSCRNLVLEVISALPRDHLLVLRERLCRMPRDSARVIRIAYGLSRLRGCCCRRRSAELL